MKTLRTEIISSTFLYSYLARIQTIQILTDKLLTHPDNESIITDFWICAGNIVLGHSNDLASSPGT